MNLIQRLITQHNNKQMTKHQMKSKENNLNNYLIIGFIQNYLII